MPKVQTLKELTAEYKQLTGKDRKFSSKTVAKKALDGAKITTPKKEVKPKKEVQADNLICVDGGNYRNLWEAIMATQLGGTAKYTKFRKELSEKGSADFKGKTYKVIKK